MTALSWRRVEFLFGLTLGPAAYYVSIGLSFAWVLATPYQAQIQWAQGLLIVMAVVGFVLCYKAKAAEEEDTKVIGTMVVLALIAELLFMTLY